MNLILAKICAFMTNMPMKVDRTKYDIDPNFEWVFDVVDVIDMVTWPLLILVASAGTIYAIVLGVQMARADSTEKREEAKKRLISVVVAVVVLVVLVLFFMVFMPMILKAALNVPDDFFA